MKITAKNICFILVEPRHPGNIGSAARAIKTMGFRHLYLVNPADVNSPEVRWLAHASEEIIENARIFNTLEDALQGMHFVVATTQRKREFRFPYYSPVELSRKIIPLSREHKIAIVFGREDSGLTNEELQLCHAISTVPAAVKHPSLNLAQAVMIYCYEFYQASYQEEKQYRWRLANHQEIEKLHEHLRTSLQKVEFIPQDSWDNFIMRFRRFFGRSNPEVRDVRMMHKILQAFDFYIEKLERQLLAEKEK